MGEEGGGGEGTMGSVWPLSLHIFISSLTAIRKMHISMTYMGHCHCASRWVIIGDVGGGLSLGPAGSRLVRPVAVILHAVILHRRWLYSKHAEMMP